MKMHSVNKVDENVEKIARLFPNCVTESLVDGKLTRVVDFDMLRQELSSFVVEGREERYQFTWPDKKKSVLLANAPINKTLRPSREESVNFDKTENLYIEGDNLEVLKLLQETYLGKIDVIYIDPPYNTGRNLIYKNNFASNADDYLANSGQLDNEGNLLVSNTESNGRFHTDWLNMIYTRLKIAKQLLKESGILVLTIDDCEIQTVTMVLNEIFGEQNHFGTVIIKNNPQGRSSVTGFQISHEYALFFAKSPDATLGKLPRNEEQISRYKEKDDYGPFEWRNFRAQYSTESPKMVYPIFVKCDGSDFRIPQMKWNEQLKKYVLLEEKADDEIISLPVDETGRTRTWKWSIETVNKVKSTDMGVRKDRGGIPTVYYKGRMNDDGMQPYTVWDKPEYSSSTFGANLLSDIIGKGIFSYPKSLFAVIDSLKVANASNDAIVLDFFSGSASTAHATMQLNVEDGGHRKFIMVQLPEETDEKSEAYKAGYKNICEIGKERIRRAGKKIVDEAGLTAQNLDIGFRVLKCDSSNMKDVYYNPSEYTPSLFSSITDNIKDDRTPEDLLFQVMLDLGILLSSKIEETAIAGKKVFSVADGYLIACFDVNITDETIKEIAQKKPYYFVMRDGGYASDSVATNFDQIFAAYSPTTIRKVL